MCKTCDILGPGKICGACQQQALQEAAEAEARHKEAGISWITWHKGGYTPQQIIDAIVPVVVERSEGNVEYYKLRVAPAVEKIAVAQAAVETAAAAKEEKRKSEIAAAKLLEENGFVREGSYTDPGHIYLNFSRHRTYRVDSACQKLLTEIREYRTDLERAQARAARTGGDHTAAIAAIQVDIDTAEEKHRKLYDELTKLNSVYDQWFQIRSEYSSSHSTWKETIKVQQKAEAEAAQAKAEAAVPFEGRLKANVLYILAVERLKVVAEYTKIRGHVGGGGCYAYYNIEYEPNTEELSRMEAASPIRDVMYKIDDARDLIERGAPITVSVNAGAGGGPNSL